MKYVIAYVAAASFLLAMFACPRAHAQLTQQDSSNNSGLTSGATTGGISGTPFGNLSSSGQGGTSRNPFGGSATQGGLFGGATGQLLGAAGLSRLFTQGQNRNATGTGQLGSRGGLGTTNLGGMGRGGIQGNRNSRFGRNGGLGSQSQVVVRTKLRVGFSYPDVASSRVTAKIAKELKTPGIQTLGPPLTVTMAATDEGTVVVLRGTVATQEDRLVAEQMTLLEPGISKVRNELKVAPATGQQPLPPPDVAPANTGSPG